jgi:hypothetical protein
MHGLAAAFHVTHLFFAEFMLRGFVLTEVGQGRTLWSSR